jgi:hypothetical protein
MHHVGAQRGSQIRRDADAAAVPGLVAHVVREALGLAGRGVVQPHLLYLPVHLQEEVVDVPGDEAIADDAQREHRKD